MDNPILRNKGRVLSIALGLLLFAGLLYASHGHLDQETLMALSEDLPIPLILAAFLVLPLVGFSFRILLILVGFRFGLFWGAIVSGSGIVAHNIAAYYLARSTFRARVRAFMEKSGYAIPSIPHRHRIWFTAVIAAVPGPPYFAKLYLLALTDLPLRIYAGIGAPVYFLFSFVPIVIGSIITDFNMKWVYLLTAVFVLSLLIGLWLKKRYSPEQMLKTQSSSAEKEEKVESDG